MSDKIYCGNGKTRHFDNGGAVRKVVIDVDSIIREYANHGFVTDKGNRKITIAVSDRLSPDSYGNDLSVTIDTWHPEGYQPPQPIIIGGNQPQPQRQATAPQPFSGYSPNPQKPFSPPPSNTNQNQQYSGYQSGWSFEDDIPF